MDNFTHEEHLLQSLQTNIKQFKIAVTFVTCCNGIFNITSKENKFYFLKSSDDDEYTQITIPPGVYEIEFLDKEIK